MGSNANRENGASEHENTDHPDEDQRCDSAKELWRLVLHGYPPKVFLILRWIKPRDGQQGSTVLRTGRNLTLPLGLAQCLLPIIQIHMVDYRLGAEHTEDGSRSTAQEEEVVGGRAYHKESP
jgi:hypothetical protein